ncbi:MAG: hypothetical protein JW956_14990 [Calditrichaceae bacterium]|nr:hypothetical protein [Calditrichaceae bacterium]
MKLILVILNLFVLFLLSSVLITCSSSSNPASSSTNDTFYFEDFNRPLGSAVYAIVNATSFFKELENGWLVYAEDLYQSEGVDTLFNWYFVKDTINQESYLRGITSLSGEGNLWLYKYYEVNEDDSLYISVNGRTSKNHSGLATGPSMYIYNGKMEYPSQEAEELIDWTIYRWESYELSPWINLNLEIQPQKSFITVALKVNDAWESYQKFTDFDNLVVISK